MLAQLPHTQEIPLAGWTQTMQRSVLRQMIAVVSRPGILSFAGGLPDPALFPTTDYAAALAHVLATDPKALQYGMPFAPLKQHIVQLMALRGVTCTAEQIFLTTGAQQGLDVLARLLLDPGGEVMFEELVYTGAQQVVAPFLPHILPVSTDLVEGMNVDEVEAYLAGGARPSGASPAFIYTIPDAHNPLGVSMSQTRRERLVELALAYNVPLIEDDPYGLLQYGEWEIERFQSPNLPISQSLPLRALNDSHVFYLGSFSKIMAPALRLGWIVAPAALVTKIGVVKEAADLESSALTQRAVAAYLDAGHLPGHLATLRREYGRRRDAMLAALYRYFPAEARWTEPQGGMFIWVELPEEMDAAVLLETAIAQENIVFIPGHAFTVPGRHIHNCMRLNFSNCSEEMIEDGIKRLAKIINCEL
ncbi:MAG: PLP-dependent aminotransferase family protein [Chloroflexi bacterium]|nr:PLP-dependent aminotransferase family protein [Ardenticatenaceae bacterium]MBL1127246.1 PLP-dependent aminotransferase family protein [Chloroflexota bacterium]NOG33308.1 PLP-dependent aminotransferase family protein [Chloroflexota bacterium]GIK56130.1 MAG: GntR family transcriptional regulator [Chloroflexota bacterium]